MVFTTAPARRIHEDDFAADPHAARYRGVLRAHPDATRRLLELLNDPANEQRLVDAESHGFPARTGIVRSIEGDPAIAPALAVDRFRQAVGVAVKLKMAHLGWRITGRKGAVRGAERFAKAEHYEGGVPVASDARARGLAALEAVARIGDESERAETGRELLESLAATRATEERTF